MSQWGQRDQPLCPYISQSLVRCRLPLGSRRDLGQGSSRNCSVWPRTVLGDGFSWDSSVANTAAKRRHASVLKEVSGLQEIRVAILEPPLQSYMTVGLHFALWAFTFSSASERERQDDVQCPLRLCGSALLTVAQYILTAIVIFSLFSMFFFQHPNVHLDETFCV